MVETKEFINRTVCELTGHGRVEGNKFGLELELEGRNVGLQDVAVRGWQRHADGSLRGESVEFTTAGAKDLDETKKSIIDLFKKFKDNNVKFNDSIRTSTHVHLNFGDKTLKQVVNFFCLFTVLEEVLQYYSGEDRKGNLFCISTREAEGIVGVLTHALKMCSFGGFAGDKYKYAACNLSTLYKFGTIEVRTMKGATSAEHVNAWVDILNDMYVYAQKMVSPGQLIRDLSVFGAERLMKTIFSPASYKELLLHYPDVLNLNYSLMEGARILQVFAFEFEDDFTAVVEVKKPEPKAKKGAKKADDAFAVAPLPNNGQIAIYKADGHRWFCTGEHGGRWWAHLERVEDDGRYYYNAVVGRFCCRFPDHEYQCNWWKHPVHGDEGAGPINLARPMGDADIWDEPEPEFDERDDDF